MSEHVRTILFKLVRQAATFVVLGIIGGATVDADSQKLLLAQRDEVKAFDVTTGSGIRSAQRTGWSRVRAT